MFFGHHNTKKDIELIESFQRGTTRMGKGKGWRGSLMRNGSGHSVQPGKTEGEFTVVFNMLPRASRGAATDLFTLMTNHRDQGKDREMSQEV